MSATRSRLLNPFLRLLSLIKEFGLRLLNPSLRLVSLIGEFGLWWRPEFWFCAPIAVIALVSAGLQLGPEYWEYPTFLQDHTGLYGAFLAALLGFASLASGFAAIFRPEEGSREGFSHSLFRMSGLFVLRGAIMLAVATLLHFYAYASQEAIREALTIDAKQKELFQARMELQRQQEYLDNYYKFGSPEHLKLNYEISKEIEALESRRDKLPKNPFEGGKEGFYKGAFREWSSRLGELSHILCVIATMFGIANSAAGLSLLEAAIIASLPRSFSTHGRPPLQEGSESSPVVHNGAGVKAGRGG